MNRQVVHSTSEGMRFFGFTYHKRFDLYRASGIRRRQNADTILTSLKSKMCLKKEGADGKQSPEAKQFKNAAYYYYTCPLVCFSCLKEVKVLPGVSLTKIALSSALNYPFLLIAFLLHEFFLEVGNVIPGAIGIGRAALPQQASSS